VLTPPDKHLGQGAISAAAGGKGQSLSADRHRGRVTTTAPRHVLLHQERHDISIAIQYEIYL
jgi:hypothetical protein